MRREKIHMLVAMIISAATAIAQQPGGKIKGNVTTSDGQPAEFVNIGLKGTGKGTSVDSKGGFELNNVRPGSYLLVSSFTGLETKEIPIEVKAGEITLVPPVILRENAQQLQEVQVFVRKRGYKTSDPSPSLRIQTPILETPQSIVTITNEVIQDQQLLVMTDVAKNVSGVTTVYPDAGVHTDFAIRGTRAIANRLRNGMSMGGYYSLQEDMSYVESVEFIKGPAGFMLAQGEPGGMFNVVTKKPLKTSHVSSSFVTGSYGLFRTSADIGGPLSKKLFYRINVMGQKSGSHIDYGRDDRFSLAPVIRYEFTDKTALTVEYNLDIVALKSTLPLMPTVNHKPLPRNFMIDDPGIDPSKYKSHYGLVNLQHKINDSWKLTAQIGFSAYTEDNYQLFDWGTVDSNGMLDRFFRYNYQKDKAANGQVFFNGDVNTGKINHKLLIGFDGGVYENIYKNYTVPDSVLPINVYEPVYGVGPMAATLIDKSALDVYPLWQTGWQAVSVMDNIKLLDWLQLTAGGRYTYFQDGYAEKIKTDKAFTPRAGLLFQPDKNTSLYFLYDQSFIAQTGISFAGEKFKPLTGNNIEFGFKKEWLKKRLLTQLAMFRIIKNNALTEDPDNPGFSLQRGQIISKGIEIDIMGSVNKNLNVIVNYAYTDAKITKDTDPNIRGTREAAPAHVVNGWAKYQVLSGKIKGLGIGLGASYHKDRYMFTEKRNSSDAQISLPDLTEINSALYYKTGNLSLALNIDNLADAYNYIGYFDHNLGANGEYRIMSLPGRNFRLSATYAF